MNLLILITGLIATMRYFLILASCLLMINASSQGNYLVNHYTPQDYRAGTQNWSIDSGPGGFIYIANSNGLMIFDGSGWKLYPNPGKTIMRAVSVARDGRVYTGSFEEFGYWQKEESGDFMYHSLSDRLKDYDFHNDEIWKIVQLHNKVYFQSFSALFVYDGSKVSNIRIPGTIIFLLRAGERLFIQTVTGSLYELKNDSLHLLDTGDQLKGTEVRSILPYNDSFLIGTSTAGVYLYNGQELVPWDVPANEKLRRFQINNGIVSGDKIIYGTIVKGIFILDFDGNIIHHLNNENDLQDNTVLSLAEDEYGNIWAGLDKGVDRIVFNSPLEIYRESGRMFGAVYTAVLEGNTLYLGTNQGIYTYYFDDGTGSLVYSGFLNQSQGQVWELKKIGEVLFCGHTTGTYIINNGSLQRISGISGGYVLKSFFANGSEYLIQGTYSSLVLYRKVSGNWTYQTEIRNFLEPSRFLEIDPPGSLWIGHAIKGLHHLTLNGPIDSVINEKQFGVKDGLPSDFNIGVFRIGSRVVFTTGQQLFTYDDLSRKIIPFTELNQQLEGFETADRIVPMDQEQYLFICRDELALFSIHDNQARLQFRLLLPLFSINMVDHYENVVQIDRDRILICMEDGFAILHLSRLKAEDQQKPLLVLRDIISLNSRGETRRIENKSGSFTLTHSWNTLMVSFAFINHRCINSLFQYKLDGLDQDWSPWSEKQEVLYSRLPQGKYTFSVRTITPGGMISEPATISFLVMPAWYNSWFAYIIYFVLIGGMILISQYFFRRRIVRQHLRLRLEAETRSQLEKQRAEQEIMRLQNEKLQSEISHKNIELANSTMAIVRKNELLIEIKEELDHQREVLGNNYPARHFEKLLALIRNNISDDQDWKMFEELFDQAHADFFKRLKNAYPDLTQSDLKLCAYLKLNLSSKEIAPLLNISFRGVETRRYRLRRRLALESDANLVEFIMQF